MIVLLLAPAQAFAACTDCPREGQPGIPDQVVVGWKVWTYDNAAQRVNIFTGKTLADWQKLPDGILIVMLYYNRFNTTGEVRYRRVEMGNDFYFVAPGLGDFIYGHSDDKPDAIQKKYIGAVVKAGVWIDDATYKRIVAEAMSDYSVSAMGIAPVPGTSDR